MSAVLHAGANADFGARLAFQKQLQAVTNKIHATSNIDEIMLEVSADICVLFNADRLTIYSLDDDKTSNVSKIKTGLNSFKDLRLPITEQSIAGHVALAKRLINIRDVYDEAELKSVHPELRFLREVPARFTVVFDEEGKTPAAFDVKGMPSSYLIDREGRVAAVEDGFHEERAKAIEQRIRALLERR